jgi:sarcosine oxidase subunit beta
MELFRQNVALQQKLGLEVYLLSAQEAKEIVPQLNVEDITSATYCPTDGYADPYSVVQGFAYAARRLGVTIHEDTPVIGIEAAEGRVRGVLTYKRKFQAPIVVNAAGPHAGQVGKMVSLDIPIRPSRRHIFVTAPADEIPRNSPVVIDFHTGFWFRKEGRRLIFGMRNPDEPEGFDTTVDWGFLPALGQVACHRLPVLSNIGIMRGQAGLHADTPDYQAIIGPVPEVEGFYLACGFSGHGFMHSPATGRLMAELILERKDPLNALPLGLGKFQEQVSQKERGFV